MKPGRGENEGREVPKSLLNGLRRRLGRLLGRPGGPRGLALNPAVAFWVILGRPGGGPGALWGALGIALGALGASFVAPGSFFWRLGGARGDNRAGSLKKQRLGIDFWMIFGAGFRCF